MEIFRFENEWALYLLSAIPATALLFFLFWHQRKKALVKFADWHLTQRLAPSLSNTRHFIRLGLLLLAMAFLAIGIANPQLGSKLEEVKREGIDIMVALDLSRSMNAADVQPSRMDQAKQFVSQFIDELNGDRVGLVIFAGNAYLQMPLTVDYSAAHLFLSGVNTEIIPTQGTALGEAIRLSTESLQSEGENYKAVVLISDGENHEGEAIRAANEASEQGILVHTIGVGSINGGPVPVIKGGRQIDFQRDRDGNIITSKMNEEMLRSVADAANGSYTRLTNIREDINWLTESLSGLEKKEMEARVFTDYEDQFQYFIAAALLILLAEMLVSYRKSSWLSKRKWMQP